MQYNPATKTYFRRKGGKIQHYSSQEYVCLDCGSVFYPEIRSQSLVLQVSIAIASAIFFAIFFIFFRGYLSWLVVLLVCYSIYYMSKTRKTVNKKETARYGETILVCPQCGSASVEPLRDKSS